MLGNKFSYLILVLAFDRDVEKQALAATFSCEEGVPSTGPGGGGFFYHQKGAQISQEEFTYADYI
jgi:hypothetical protein